MDECGERKREKLIHAMSSGRKEGKEGERS